MVEQPSSAARHFVAADARNEDRITVWLERATLRERGCSAAPVIVHDLSPNGFRTEWPYLLRVGDIVWLKLPGFEAMQSIVAWNANFQVGCRFQMPLHRAVFERIVKANKQQSGRQSDPAVYRAEVSNKPT